MSRRSNKASERTLGRKPAPKDDEGATEGRKGRRAALFVDAAAREDEASPAGLRRRLALTQRQMADRLGMSLKGWQEIERGRRFDDGMTVQLDIRTRLALSAVAFGLQPWPTGQRIARRYMVAVSGLSK